MFRAPDAVPVTTVFLDVGDTLLHIHPDVPTLYARALRDEGVDVATAELLRALVSGETVYRDAVRSGRPFESSVADAARFWGEYTEHLLGVLGVAPGASRAALAARLAARFWAPSSWRPFPEVPGVLAALRHAGLQVAVVSNFTDTLVGICAAHGLTDHIDVLVASAVHGAQKPDVSIFREALRRTGADPAASVHVGDNYVADVLGARAAGITPVLLHRARAGRPGMYDFTLEDAAGVPAVAAPRPRLDCAVIGDLAGLLPLLGVVAAG